MKLLKIEWLKLRKYTTFWLLISLFGGLSLAITYKIAKDVGDLDKSPLMMFSKLFTFPQIWENTGYVYSYFVLFLSVFMIISVTNEFSYKTNRQHIIDGMQRTDFLHAKALLVLVISIGATLFFSLMVLLFGFMNGGGNLLDHSENIVYVFLYTINYLSFAAMVAFFIKRSGLSIILLLSYILIEAFMSTAINLKFDTYFGSFLPLQSSDDLFPSLLTKLKTAMPGTVIPESAPVYTLIAVSLLWISIYYLILRRKILTTDL